MVRSSTKVIITNKDQILIDRETPDLSAVYMRSLVKKNMSSSNLVRKQQENYGLCQGGSYVKAFQGSSEFVNPQPSTLQTTAQQHKKKVRRRMHTSRPYQERLLNMAEARREIVTALKFHRASMKRQQHEQQQGPLHTLLGPYPDLGAELGMDPAKSPVIHPSEGGQIFPRSFEKYHQPCPASFTYDSSNHSLSSCATIPSVSSYEDNSSFSFSLPSQTLGLNLNFQNFCNLSTSPFQTNPSLFTSPTTSNSSPALSSTTTDEVHFAAEYAHNEAFQTDNIGGITSPYPAMDSEAMKEIKSMGDCYDMVWNDTLNSLTSAWWLKLSNAAELGSGELKRVEDDGTLFPLSPTG